MQETERGKYGNLQIVLYHICTVTKNKRLKCFSTNLKTILSKGGTHIVDVIKKIGSAHNTAILKRTKCLNVKCLIVKMFKYQFIVYFNRYILSTYIEEVLINYFNLGNDSKNNKCSNSTKNVEYLLYER